MLSKQTAIELMLQGEKLTHKGFSANEWMSMDGNHIIFEDGCRCWPDEFWRSRTDPVWDHGWDLFRD